MKTRSLFLRTFLLTVCIISLLPTLTAEAEQVPQKQSTRSKMIFGPPVNVNIAGPGSMPEGVLMTGINTSFADKVTKFGNPSRSPDVFSQAWLLKLRYGITDYLEVWTTTPYYHQRRTNPEPTPHTIYGVGDTVLALTFGPWHERRGDPVTISGSVGLWLPMAAWGDDNPPGLGVLGFRGQAAVGKFVTKDIKVETEGVWSTRFARGNQEVRLGDQFQWNSQIRYLFDHFDIGVESSMVWQFSSDRYISGRGTRDLRNGYTEWFVGPSVNVAIEPLGMWAGIGAFFPVMRYTDSPTKVENVRFEFKIAKLW